MLISDKVYSCRLLCCVSLLQNKSKMLNFSYFVDVLLNAAFSVHHYQVCGYWSRCYQCYSNVFSKPVCANEYDWLKFIEWFHTIKDDDDDDAYCVVSCEPKTAVSEKVKHLSIKGKVTNIVDDHGLIEHYIYFHFKDITGFGNKVLPSVGDIVQVDAEQSRAEGGWIAKHVLLQKEENVWDDLENDEFRVPTTYEERGAMVGQITSFDEAKECGTIQDSVSFCLSDVVDDYKPMPGDWVQASVSVGSIANNIRPVRTKQLTGTVNFAPYREGGSGTINTDVYFNTSVCNDNYQPRKGDQVAATVVESKQGHHCWRATEVKFVGRLANQAVANNKGNKWILRGERPQLAAKVASLPSFLPQFDIPESLRKCLLEGGDLLSLHPKLAEVLTAENFAVRFSTLLFMEELAIEAEVNSFRLHSVSLTHRGLFIVLHVPGLSTGKPSLFVGDMVYVKPLNDLEMYGDDGAISLEGYIHHIVMETEELLIKFHEEFHRSLDESDRYDVSFSYSRTPFRRCHLSVKLAKERFAKDLLFPAKNGQMKTCEPQVKIQLFHDSGDSNSKQGSFLNEKLNNRQKHAVSRILLGEARPKPYILFGPPGTGKTVTLVEAILQVVTHIPSCRLLVCAPSNSAVDLLCERLHDSGKITTDMMVRFNAYRRPPQAIPEKVKQYCHLGDSLVVMSRYKLVLATCVNAGTFYSLSLRRDHFTHVYIDEAGQATEPECLIPIGLGAEGQIVLTGDPKQLGAALKSSYAVHYGLGFSLLERLMNSVEYSRNCELYSEGYNPLLVTKLVNNYRSHPSLLSISSCLFYDNELQYFAPENLSTFFCDWSHLPNEGFPSIFHGIVGSQLREENSPSWFNAEEIVQVCTYVKLLLNNKKKPCQPEDIGVITPYRKQVEKLRMMFKAINVVGVKIGSVEEFQGQERKVIILSTVRSRSPSECADNNTMTTLGFLANPKRFNVSITRAIALMIVIGNPYVLHKDEYWRALLKHHAENNSYVGCDISSILQDVS